MQVSPYRDAHSNRQKSAPSRYAARQMRQSVLREVSCICLCSGCAAIAVEVTLNAAAAACTEFKLPSEGSRTDSGCCADDDDCRQFV